MAGPGSLILCAPPCSSWCRVSRGTTWRTRLNPLGLDYSFVEHGNLAVSRLLGTLLPPRSAPRLSLILVLADAVHAVWMVEQPSGSEDVLPYHPRLDWVFNDVVYASWRSYTYNASSS